MALRYLLDTNVLSETVRSKPMPAVVERLDRALGMVATAASAWHELDYGRRRVPPGRRRTELDRRIRDLADELPVLAYDVAAARWHAEQRARLVSAGRTPPFTDGQIAAVAATNNLVLVTRNVRDFRGFDGLDVESWFD